MTGKTLRRSVLRSRAGAGVRTLFLAGLVASAGLATLGRPAADAGAPHDGRVAAASNSTAARTN
ncbi:MULTISPECIES: hypothetical protein [Methylobacterium]|nr:MULTISPECIES: hypothetical protein [Methylobacterium]GBU16198.1 hypothetical protein AwMethylo_04130 [Methylobacterium sp.]